MRGTAVRAKKVAAASTRCGEVEKDFRRTRGGVEGTQHGSRPQARRSRGRTRRAEPRWAGGGARGAPCAAGDASGLRARGPRSPAARSALRRACGSRRPRRGCAAPADADARGSGSARRPARLRRKRWRRHGGGVARSRRASAARRGGDGWAADRLRAVAGTRSDPLGPHHGSHADDQVSVRTWLRRSRYARSSTGCASFGSIWKVSRQPPVTGFL